MKGAFIIMNWLERLGGADAVIHGILQEFESFCAIPHPSRGEQALSEALCRRFEEAGQSPETDAAHNLKLDLPATPGCEGAPLLVLQGHLDMVCAVAPGSGWRPDTDRVVTQVRDGFLCSDGRSSLGADNNLGNATLLWLLGQGVPHGPLRLLFTTAEEVGLAGAKRVDPSWLAGAAGLLNTDGFHLGRLVVGSAGGRRETFRHPLETRAARAGEGYTLTLSGFAGGHSGDDIHKGRCNALQTLATFLLELDLPYAIGNFSGGQGHNVIPGDAGATLLLRSGEGARLTERVEELRRRLAEAHGDSDPGHRVELAAVPAPEVVWSPGCAHETLTLVAGLHHGVSAWHADFPTVPAASANAARLWEEDGVLQVSTFLRCTTREQEEKLAKDHRALAQRCGFDGQVVSYPGWAGDRSNPLARLMEQVYQNECGQKAEVTVVHVGLEPSVLQAKAPGLVMVVAGPDILDAHSIQERAPLDSLPPYAALLAGTLEAVSRLERLG